MYMQAHVEGGAAASFVPSPWRKGGNYTLVYFQKHNKYSKQECEHSV
jgi:hypothetical protein